MLDVLCKRKRIRDFLKLYSPTKWGDVISNICEIAILYAKSFSKYVTNNLTSVVKNKNSTERIYKTMQKFSVEKLQSYFMNYIPQF